MTHLTFAGLMMVRQVNWVWCVQSRTQRHKMLKLSFLAIFGHLRMPVAVLICLAGCEQPWATSP